VVGLGGLGGFALKRSTLGRRALRLGALAVLSLGLSVAAGAARVTMGGTVVAWGCGGGLDFGQCSVPAGLAGVTAIAAGTYHSLALKSDGSVVAWGCGRDSRGVPHDNGQCSVPAGLSGVTAIAANVPHSLALKDDGSVVAWGCANTPSGNPNFGQCNVPEGLAGVTAIAAGYGHNLALKSDRTVAAWGCGGTAPKLDLGQCNVPAGLSGVTAIDADLYDGLALVTGTPAIALLSAKASGKRVSVRVKISNWKMYPALVGKKPNKPDGGHWRIYVDGRYNSFSTQATTGKTTKLKPGTHRIWVILANNDDTAVAGTRRSRTLTVVVKRSR
jgi:Regulator of chromosome condensation (RCC1) repeat